MVQDRSLSSKALDVFTHTFLLAVLIACAYPIVLTVSLSLSAPEKVAAGAVMLLPVQFTWESFLVVLNDRLVPRALLNSIVITGLGTLWNIMLTTLAAYALAKAELPFRRTFMVVIVITMFVSGGLIPEFLLVRALGLYNSYLALVLPTGISAFNLLVLMTFFRHFPSELEDSAKVDGHNDVFILFRIVVPLSMAAIATISLFYAVAHWNSWFPAYIYLRDQSSFPLQLILRGIVLENELADRLMQRGQAELASLAELERANQVSRAGIQYATLVIALIPMLVLYPFVQKYFVQGIMIGSIKG